MSKTCSVLTVPGGVCDKPATRRVDSRAIGKPDASLDVCDEHYVLVKEHWLKQAQMSGTKA